MWDKRQDFKINLVLLPKTLYMKNKRVILFSFFVLTIFTAFCQSVYMHEAQDDAAESGGISTTGLFTTLILIGIIYIIVKINNYNKDIKKHNEQVRIRAQKLENEAKQIAASEWNSSYEFSRFRNGENWKKGYIQAIIDKKKGTLRDITDNYETLNKEYIRMNIFFDHVGFSTQDYYRKKMNELPEKIGYLEKLNYDKYLEQCKEINNNGKNSIKAEKITETKEEEVNNNSIISDFVLSNDGKELLEVKITGRVSIPEGVEKINQKAFFCKKNITEVIFPNSIKEIAENAFLASSIEKLYLPGTIEKCGVGTFSNCRELQEIEIGEGFKCIVAEMFEDCENLRIVKLPSTIEVIGKAAFASCWLIKEINIPSNVHTIVEEAFSNCQSLRTLTLPIKLKRIGGGAFRRCFELKEIIIPENVIGIPEYTFYECISLEKVYFKGNTACIMDNAFGQCGKLEITLPNSMEYIEPNAFEDSHNIKIEVPYGKKKWIIEHCGLNEKNVLVYRPKNKFEKNDNWEKEKDSFLRLEEHIRKESRNETLRSLGIMPEDDRKIMESIYFDDDF